MSFLFGSLQRVTMPLLRMKVIQRHLCCSATSTNVSSSSQAPTDSANHSPIVQQTLKAVSSVIETSRGAETAANSVMLNYSLFDSHQRLQFLTSLAEEYQCNNEVVLDKAEALTNSFDKAGPHKHMQRLRESLVPPYDMLFREIGAAAGGVKFLVDFRSHVIAAARNCSNLAQAAALQAMSASLKQLLGLWFGVGFLNLERVTWQSPCDLLEKVANYEGVHPVRNVSDLRLRVGAYRRCYVFMHPSMPGEPMVILHVALVKGISDSIQSIVHHPTLSKQSDFTRNYQLGEDPTSFDTAVFYSITSTQAGLKGIDLGNYLIKSVVKLLLSEFPHLTNFSSLSPIPGFRDWLQTEINQLAGGFRKQQFLTAEQCLECSAALSCKADEMTVLGALKTTLQDGTWSKDAVLANSLKNTLMNLCARYLCHEKHRNSALNSVANFHLRNGATLWRINWLANTTAKGLSESCGLMVNYRYYIEKTSINSEKYSQQHVIDADDQVLDLLIQL
ncbi:malonyl-CoA decarboxylase, mitochondrial-like [Watersipora subatra]|uniref:malonyl-CoA decarboxylase, mitochondrial-like n=1 Tax=Watersipora subatra TaxID=2589382 RepID=UPI00355B6AE7